MNRDLLKEYLGKLVGQRNSFLLFSAILAVAVVLLSAMLCFKKERIVIVPTTGASFWVEEGKVSSGYIEKMGLFLSDLLLNRSAADVEKRNQIVLQHVHPSFYPSFKKLLKVEQEGILRGDQSFFFRVENSHVDAARNAFVVEGESVLLVGHGAKEIAQNEKKRYVLQFQCENGKLLLTSLKKEMA